MSRKSQNAEVINGFVMDKMLEKAWKEVDNMHNEATGWTYAYNDIDELYSGYSENYRTMIKFIYSQLFMMPKINDNENAE